jgi:hypothetical protein
MTSIVSAAFSKDLFSKTPKEDDVVISNGENEVSALPAVTAEMLGENRCSGDLKHPTIPGWFSEDCPIWPGEFHFQFNEVFYDFVPACWFIYIYLCSDTLTSLPDHI